jgi:O-antigen ligase
MTLIAANKVALLVALVLCLSGLDIFLSRLGVLPGASLMGIFVVLVSFIIYSIRVRVRYRLSAMRLKSIHVLSFIFVFLVWVFFSSMYAPNVIDALTASVRYSIYFITAILLMLHWGEDEFQSVFNLAISSSLIIICGSIWWDFLSNTTMFGTGLRPAGIMLNPNAAAQSAVMLLQLAFLSFKSSRVIYFMVALVSLSIFATLSRSGLVLLFVCLLSGLILRRNQGLFRIDLKSLSLIVVSLSLFFVLLWTYISSISNITIINRIGYMFSGGGFVDLNDPRIVLLQQYSSEWLEKPYLGYGTASSYRNESAILGATHNVFIKVLFENGLVGATILFISLTLLFFVSLRRVGSSIIFPWIVVLSWGIFTNTILDSRLFYSMIVALMFFTDSQVRKINPRNIC